ncbi:hypothetical protein KVR01_011886 [Diaporthe batatas]|uniref:uncharacterized protein n=1 Tax=Diaporthe batatas TaxID=748121 RepID=UPI001D04FBA2|nr:uncharacterized protein KVR01_011886 [Diaporthe batatas]KAG8158125.1 hypothetical protein KVR01_011886 [Diaporthe batatas]
MPACHERQGQIFRNSQLRTHISSCAGWSSIPVGLDGEKVEKRSELGTSWPRGRSREQVFVEFVIDYRTYQHLTKASKDPVLTEKLAYCPLAVNYRSQTRHIDTEVFRSPRKGKPFKVTQDAFHDGLKAWEDSEEYEKLRNSLMTSIVLEKTTKIVAFACCTMSLHLSWGHNSITQHALILTVKDILQKKNVNLDQEIKLYAQDPVYTDVDKAVLEADGIHMLDDPYGFLEVDDSSIVISFSPKRSSQADCSRHCTPRYHNIG